MDAASDLDTHRELETLYANDPPAYRRRVRRLVALGYGYVLLCLLVIGGFIAGGGFLFATGTLRLGFVDEFLRVGIPAVAVAAMMVRALFVRIDPPEGHYLEGELRDAVLAFIEPTRAATGGCEVHEIVLVPEVNAAVQQRPRFGLVGPSTNSVILGVPLLEVMSADEVRAVIGHEFGHLSHAHGKMGARVYRLNHTLQQVATAIEEKAHSSFADFTYHFFNWFYPRFDTVTFAMRRGQEYEADRTAAEATSRESIALALCRLQAAEPAIERYWSMVWQRARDQQDNQEERPYSRFGTGYVEIFDGDEAAKQVNASLRRQTDFEDTHPSLCDRLAALETEPINAPPPATNALEVIFRPDLREQLLEDLDLEWHERSRDAWAERHQQYRDAEATREALHLRRADLNEAELIQLAELEQPLLGEKNARATIEAGIEKYPESADLRFRLAQNLFFEDFDAAERNFTDAVERDLEWFPEAWRYVSHQYEQEGKSTDDSPLAPFQERYDTLVEKAEAERESVNIEDEFFRPTLNGTEADQIVTCLKAYPEIESLNLMEKRPDYFQEHRIFVLGLDINVFHDNVESNNTKWLERVTPIISEALPGPNSHFPIILEKDSVWSSVFDKIDGARIYQRQVSARQRFWERLKTAYQFAVLLFIVGVVAYVVWYMIAGD